jgi:peptide/nickel transport system substrate-binding protein
LKLAGAAAAAGITLDRPGWGQAPKRGGKLIFAVPAGPASIEPHVEGADIWHRRKPLVYENLTWVDFDMRVRPQLAESWTNPDPTTYVFKVRRGVKFHNGKELDAEDIKYSYERVMDPKTGSGGRGDFAIVKGIEAVDKYTVRVTLKEPFAAVLAALGGRYNAVIPKEFVKTGSELRLAAVGTGPFKVKSFHPGESLVLERFGDHWDRGKPYLDELVVQVVPDEASIMAGLRSGTIDAAAFEDTKNFYLAQKESRLNVLRGPSLRWEVLDLMGDVPPTDKLEVRQAISLAIDREAILKVAGNGIGQVLGFLPPALKPYALPPDQLPFNKRDVARAKELLAKAGYAGGVPLTLRTIVGYPQLEAAAQIIIANLAEVGIDAKIEVVEIGVWIKDWIARKSPITMNSWGGFADPDLALWRHFRTSPGMDFRRLNNKEADALLDQGRTTLDPERRVKIYHDVQKLLAAQAISLPLYSADMVYAAQKHVKNLRLHPSAWYFGLREVWIDKG